MKTFYYLTFFIYYVFMEKTKTPDRGVSVVIYESTPKGLLN